MLYASIQFHYDKNMQASYFGLQCLIAGNKEYKFIICFV